MRVRGARIKSSGLILRKAAPVVSVVVAVEASVALFVAVSVEVPASVSAGAAPCSGPQIIEHPRLCINRK